MLLLDVLELLTADLLSRVADLFTAELLRLEDCTFPSGSRVLFTEVLLRLALLLADRS